MTNAQPESMSSTLQFDHSHPNFLGMLGEVYQGKMSAEQAIMDVREAMDERFRKHARAGLRRMTDKVLGAFGDRDASLRNREREERSVVGIAEEIKHGLAIHPKFSRKYYAAHEDYLHDPAWTIVARPGRKPNLSSVSVIDQFDEQSMVVPGRCIANPRETKQLMGKGFVGLKVGKTVEVAERMAQLAVLHDNVEDKRARAKISAEIGRLVRVGEAIANGEISLTRGMTIEQMKKAVSRRVRNTVATELLLGAVAIPACLGGAATEAPRGPAPEGETSGVGSGGGQQLEASPAATEQPLKVAAPTLTALPTLVRLDAALPQVDVAANFGVTGLVAVRDTETAVAAMREIGVTPLYADGMVAYEDKSSGRQYLPTLDQITGVNGVVLVRGEMDQNGVVTYASADRLVKERHLLAVDCPDNEICMEAISYNQGDQSLLYLVRTDSQGNVVAHVLTADAAAAVDSGKPIPWINGESEYWNMPVNGENALNRMGTINVVSYDQDTGMLTIPTEDGPYAVSRDQVTYIPGNGGFVEVEMGQKALYWNENTDRWDVLLRTEAVSGKNLQAGEEVFMSGGRYAVRSGAEYKWVDIQSNYKNGEWIATDQDDQKLMWNGSEWISFNSLDEGVASEIQGKLMGYHIYGDRLVDVQGDVLAGMNIELASDGVTVFYLESELNGKAYKEVFTLDELEVGDNGKLNIPGYWYNPDSNSYEPKKFSYAHPDTGAVVETENRLMSMSQAVETIIQETAKFANPDRNESSGRALKMFLGDPSKRIVFSIDGVDLEVYTPKTSESKYKLWYDSWIYIWNEESSKYDPVPTIFYTYTALGEDGQVGVMKYEDVEGNIQTIFIDHRKINVFKITDPDRGRGVGMPFSVDY